MLTPEQNKIIEDNYNLVERLTWYWYQKGHGNILSWDDCYDVCVTMLVKAAQRYDESLGFTFKTLYYSMVERGVYRALREKSALKRGKDIKKLSMDSKVKEAEGEDITVAESIVIENDYSFLENKSLLDSLWPYLEEDEFYCVYNHFIKKKEQGEIANDLGWYQVKVSRTIKKALKKLKSRIERMELIEA